MLLLLSRDEKGCPKTDTIFMPFTLGNTVYY